MMSSEARLQEVKVEIVLTERRHSEEGESVAVGMEMSVTVWYVQHYFSHLLTPMTRKLRYYHYDTIILSPICAMLICICANFCSYEILFR